MFPIPVDKWKPAPRRLYKLSLPIALLIWLLPMLAVLMTSVRSTDELGVPTQAKEAVAFALLAWLTWNNLPGNVPTATGASRPVVLGKVTRA